MRRVMKMGWRGWDFSSHDDDESGGPCCHAWAHLWPCRRRWLPQGEHFQYDFSRLRKTLMIPWRRENGGASSSRQSSRSSWASSASSLSVPLPPSFAERWVQTFSNYHNWVKITTNLKFKWPRIVKMTSNKSKCPQISRLLVKIRPRMGWIFCRKLIWRSHSYVFPRTKISRCYFCQHYFAQK